MWDPDVEHGPGAVTEHTRAVAGLRTIPSNEETMMLGPRCTGKAGSQGLDSLSGNSTS